METKKFETDGEYHYYCQATKTKKYFTVTKIENNKVTVKEKYTEKEYTSEIKKNWEDMEYIKIFDEEEGQERSIYARTESKFHGHKYNWQY